MSNPNYCHFCGRSDSLHSIPDTTKKVCSLCWEIIVYIVAQWQKVGENFFEKEEADV